MGDLACGGCDVALDGANVGSKGRTPLEGNNVPVRDGVPNLRNSEKGGGRGKNREEECIESKEPLG